MTFLSTHLYRSSQESSWRGEGDCCNFLGHSGYIIEYLATFQGELLGPPHPTFSHLQVSALHGQV